MRWSSSAQGVLAPAREGKKKARREEASKLTGLKALAQDRPAQLAGSTHLPQTRRPHPRFPPIRRGVGPGSSSAIASIFGVKKGRRNAQKNYRARTTTQALLDLDLVLRRLRRMHIQVFVHIS